MVKVNLGGCSSFVKDADYKSYVEKALSALDVLEAGTGAGNDFLGWKHLPTETPESLVVECEQIRDAWKEKGVDLEKESRSFGFIILGSDDASVHFYQLFGV